MKKIFVLAAFFVLAVCNVSFAAGTAITNDTPTAEGKQIFGGVDATDAAAGSAVLIGKMSKGVKFNAYFTDQGYAISTKHSSGSKAYGTAHDSTAIYFQDIGTAALDSVNLGAASNNAFGTAWTAM